MVVPVHWGTYSPIALRRPPWLEVPARRFRVELDARGAVGALRLLAPGDSLVRTATAAGGWS